MLLFFDPERSVSTSSLFLLESSGYQCQDGIKHPLQHFSVSSFPGDTQMLVHILQGVKASAKRGLKV
jgi:hypothetical protein